MVPAPVDNSRDVVIGPTAADTEAASIKEDKVNSTAMGAVSEDATSEKNSGASNSKNSINSSTMAPAQGMDARAEDRGQDSSLKLSVLEKGKMINSNTTEGDNSTAMAVDSMGNLNLSLSALVAGKAQEDDKSGKEDWHKVKPSKKKHKVKPSKKEQKKLTFKTPREASKSGPINADPQGINKSTGGGNRPTKTATIITPPQEATKKRKSLEDDKEKGQGNGVVGMEVEEEKTMERETPPKQPPKSVKQTSEKFISIRQTKAMSQWYLACISNKSVQGLDRDVNLTEEDLKPGSEFYGWFQWACDYSTRDKAGDDKKTVLRDPNHWFQTLTKVPNGDDLRKSEDPAKRKVARNVLEVGIDLARSPMELFKDQFVCDNRKFGLDPSEETAELVAARAAAYKFFGPVYQLEEVVSTQDDFFLPLRKIPFLKPHKVHLIQTKEQTTPHKCATYPASMTQAGSGWNIVGSGLFHHCRSNYLCFMWIKVRICVQISIRSRSIEHMKNCLTSAYISVHFLHI
jgi:hypothetical protein